jgi:hypothetical protein
MKKGKKKKDVDEANDDNDDDDDDYNIRHVVRLSFISLLCVFFFSF